MALSGPVALCLFCKAFPPSSSFEELNKHLRLHMCFANFCPDCVELKKELCERHITLAVEDKYVLKVEYPSVKLWQNRYVEKLESLTTFNYVPGCEICERLKQIGVPFTVCEDDFDDFKKHVRNHISYFPQSVTIADAPTEGILTNVRKLDTYLDEMEKLYRKKINGSPLREKQLNAEDSKISIANGFKEQHKEPVQKGSDVVKEMKRKVSELMSEPDLYASKLTGLRLEAYERGKLVKVSIEITPPHILAKAKVNRNPDIILVPSPKSSPKPKLPTYIPEPVVVPEILIDEKNIELDIPDELAQVVSSDKTKYLCVFCILSKNELEFDEAIAHYHEHLNYYPYQCGECPEATHTEYAMMKHFKDKHSDVSKARITVTKYPATDEWLQTFFQAQRDGINMRKGGSLIVPRNSCLVCELSWDKDKLKSNLSKKQDYLNHCMSHMHYLPFSCLLCKAGKSYRISTVENRTYTHIMNHHPNEIDLPLNKIIGRTHAIKPLDRILTIYMEKCRKSARFSMRSFIPISYKEKLKEKQEAQQKRDELMPSTSIYRPSDTSPNLHQSEIFPHPSSANQTRWYESLPQMQPSMNSGPFMSQVPAPFVQQYTVPQSPFFNSSPSSFVVQDTPFLLFNNINVPQHTQRLTIELTPEVFNDELIEKTKENLPDFDYFCVFCKDLQQFNSAVDATAHYAAHFNYKPVVCLLCSLKFTDVDSVTQHHKDIHATLHPGASLLYFINENEAIEGWVSRFLNFQKTKEIWNEITPSFMKSCLVCDKLLHGQRRPKYAKSEMSQAHMLNHLRYFPFECRMCMNVEGKSKRFTCLDKQAFAHLATHGIDVSDEGAAKELFRKVDVVQELEELISDFMVMQKYNKRASKRGLAAEDSSDDEPELQPVQKRFKGLADTLQTGGAITPTSICCMHCHEIIPTMKALRQHSYTLHPTLSVGCYSPKDIVRNK